MESFLQKAASYIFEGYGDTLDRMCIVFPNRRAGLFLKKHFAALVKKPFWSPRFFSTEDFVSHLTGLEAIDPVTLLFEFYEVYREVKGTEASPMDEFMQWGQVLLEDFNETDLYLADPEKLFKYLNEEKALNVWNLGRQPLTSFEKDYVSFFNSLPDYYFRLRKRLMAQKRVYQGLAYRTLAENLDEAFRERQWDKIFLVGFSALTNSEEKLFAFLAGNLQAEILWDADKYYLEDSGQEAGFFLRKYLREKKFGEFRWIGDHFTDIPKKIRIVGVPQQVGQAKYAGQILQDMQVTPENGPETAVVLAAEHLLLPVLNSLPENISAFNVTMGWPLSLSSLYQLCNGLFVMHENSRRFSSRGESGHEANDVTPPGYQTRFYFRDLQYVFSHPLVSMMKGSGGPDDGPLAEPVLRKIREQGKVFYSANEIIELLEVNGKEEPGPFRDVLSDWNRDPVLSLNAFSALFAGLRDSLLESYREGEGQEVNVELEQLYNFAILVKRLRTVLENYRTCTDLRMMNRIFNQVVRTTVLPFTGEPLQGIQLMGMLETRALDFRNLVLLSVNEEILPGGKKLNSFIPFEIRRDFNLPTHRENNAVFAYHFYRLLQRSENVWLLYNTVPGELGGGDRSRFIAQLLFEMKRAGKPVMIEEKLLKTPLVSGPGVIPVSIRKTPEIMSILMDKAAKGFSPTALNSLVKCTLQFYFTEVAGLEEPGEVEENIDSAALGTVVHKVLLDIYSGFIDQELLPARLAVQKARADAMTRAAFLQEYSSSDVDYGRNLLVVKVAMLFVKRLLTYEAGWLEKLRQQGVPVKLKMLETMLYGDLEATDHLPAIKIKGKIDRANLEGNTLLVIDYKTGQVKAPGLSLSDWDSLTATDRYDKALQLLVYAWLVHKNFPEYEDIEAGIYAFRNLSQGCQKLKLPDSVGLDDEAFRKFEEVLKELFNSLFDSSIPFEQASDASRCTYCTYKKICMR